MTHAPSFTLQNHFSLSTSEAQQILNSCSTCSQINTPHIPAGTIPQGTHPNTLWQMDFTIIPEFGVLKHVHISIDTYSSASWATALSEEWSHHVITHVLQAFAGLGVPSTIKTECSCLSFFCVKMIFFNYIK